MKRNNGLGLCGGVVVVALVAVVVMLGLMCGGVESKLKSTRMIHEEDGIVKKTSAIPLNRTLGADSLKVQEKIKAAMRSASLNALDKQKLASAKLSEHKRPKDRLADLPAYYYDNIPPQGAYFVWRNDSIQLLADLLTLYINDYANTYSSFPPISGSTSQASYTLSDFVIDMDMEAFALSAVTYPEAADVGYPAPLNFGWQSFQFIIQFNYHICASQWPNPCEDGYVQIYTTDLVSLGIDVNLDFSGPYVQASATSVSLNFENDGISIFVQCTSTLCLIPTSDIANAVADNFVTEFQNGLLNAFNNIATSKLDNIPTTVQLSEYNLVLQLNGGFALVPPTEIIPNLVFYAQAEFVGALPQPPPFEPTFVPPASIFLLPDGPANFLITEYTLQTALWALDLNGEFNRTITQSNLPASAKITLNTNSLEMKLAAPGLSAYPNMNISIGVSLHNISSIDISPYGVTAKTTFNAAFYVYNTTFSTEVWTLLVDVGFTMNFGVFMSSQNTIQVVANLSDWTSDVALASSAIGSVHVFLFQDGIKYVLQNDAPSTLPPFTYTIPSSVIISDPEVYPYPGFLEISTSVTSAITPGYETCGEYYCPEENTCCPVDGGYGCCTLPDAVCCGNGCCEYGSYCENNECYS